MKKISSVVQMVTKASPSGCLVSGKIKLHSLLQTSQYFELGEKHIKIKNADTHGGIKQIETTKG